MRAKHKDGHHLALNSSVGAKTKFSPLLLLLPTQNNKIGKTFSGSRNFLMRPGNSYTFTDPAFLTICTNGALLLVQPFNSYVTLFPVFALQCFKLHTTLS